MPMKNMPVGTIIHNIEMQPRKGGQLARSAGCYAQLKPGEIAQIEGVDFVLGQDEKFRLPEFIRSLELKVGQ